MTKPFVGIGIVVVNAENQVLMMRRKSEHGQGQYSIPGGALEPGEDLVACACRELQEETGLIIESIEFVGVANNLQTYQAEGVHSVSLIYKVDEFSGELALLEPDKHDELGWYDLNDLPQPQFEASQLAMDLLLS